MRRRADQPHHAAFHIRQKNVLLRFVEPMNFVDEQNRGLAGIFQTIPRRSQNAPHVRHIRFHAAEPFEFIFRLVGNDLRERSFAGAGRPIKNQRLNPIRFDSAPEKLAGSENVVLPAIFVQRLWAHPRCERPVAKNPRLTVVRFGNVRLRRSRKQITLCHAAKLADQTSKCPKKN